MTNIKSDDIYFSSVNINTNPLWKKGKLLIGQLDIELTERCNNNCIHCCINLPENDLSAKQKELTTDELKHIIKEAADLGSMTIRFTGGEPLLREDFKELYLFTRKLGIKVMLFTNARLIDTELVNLFAHIPPMERIEITVYGMTPKSCQAVTGSPKAYKETMQGIELLRKCNIPFIVKGAEMPQNITDREAFEDFASDIPWMEGKKPTYSRMFSFRSRRDSDKKNSMIRQLRVNKENYTKILRKQSDDSYLQEMKQFCTKFMGAPGNRLFSCGAGTGGGCIDAYGILQPCMQLRHPDTVYDLKNGNLKEAVSKFFPKLRKMQAKNTEYLRRCGRCFIKGLCEQCPAKSWKEHGTLDTPVEYLCEIAHEQARFLGLIRNNERASEVTNPAERIARL